MSIKLREVIKKYLFPILLFLFPLRHITQGIDMSDTGYNLACFRWFGQFDGMWVYATYLANAVGNFFTKLPFGGTMLGMNLYCSLVVSIIALAVWYFLKDKMPGYIVFAGEVLAIMLCWCPQIILYNYLTYLILAVGTILLYKGITLDKKGYYVVAGVVLGIGVGVRFSNLTHMALILGLWYAGFLKKRKWQSVVTDTLYCVGGYLAGIAAFIGLVQLQYGLDGYFEMMFGLKTMSGGAEGYSATDMIIGPFVDYLGSMKWGLLFLVYLAVGMWLFRVKETQFLRIKKILFVAGLLVLLRFVYGRGMFGFDYHTYFSIFWWVSLFNTVALVWNAWILFRKDFTDEEKLLAALILVTLLILPLGSNNRSYPVINNLFLIAPVTLYFLWKTLPKSFPVRAVAVGCLVVFAIQSLGFGTHFIFRDGSNTEKRDTKVENNVILKGMYTTKTNAEALAEITDFWEKEALGEFPVILYGDVPGLSYVLEAEPAITSTWANLESYNMTFWERDFALVEKNMETVKPVVIIGNAYVPIDEKAELLQSFMERNGYREILKNDKVTIYH